MRLRAETRSLRRSSDIKLNASPSASNSDGLPTFLIFGDRFQQFFWVLFLDVSDRMMPALVAMRWTRIFVYHRLQPRKDHLRVFWHQTINIGLRAQVNTLDNYLCPHRINFLPVGVCSSL